MTTAKQLKNSRCGWGGGQYSDQALFVNTCQNSLGMESAITAVIVIA